MEKKTKKISSVTLDEENDVLIVRKKKESAERTDVTAESMVRAAVEGLEALRAKKPLVHCMTNRVTAGFVADGLVALGASPAMVEDPGEVSVFAQKADALLVNVGTLSKPASEAMRAAVARANMSGKPWTLDPVAIGQLPLRTFLARELMRRYPAFIRGNASEILSLAGFDGEGRGTDSTAGTKEAEVAARRMAELTRAAVLVSGETDFIASLGAPDVRISNGSKMMARISGAGCLQGAIGAAFLGVFGQKRLEAAVAASVVVSVAAEIAAKAAKAPGSFKVALVDALYSVSAKDIESRARIAVG